MLVAFYADAFDEIDYKCSENIFKVGEKIADLIDPDDESSWDMILQEYKKIDHLFSYKWLEHVSKKISTINRKVYLRDQRAGTRQFRD